MDDRELGRELQKAAIEDAFRLLEAAHLCVRESNRSCYTPMEQSLLRRGETSLRTIATIVRGRYLREVKP